jgi:predicted restriction endonuclease
MPWRDANDAQRLDKHNGILLSANLDALFDKYLISFAEDGTLMVSDDLSAEELTDLGLARDISIEFFEGHKPYLRHHRARFEECVRPRRKRRSGG